MDVKLKRLFILIIIYIYYTNWIIVKKELCGKINK